MSIEALPVEIVHRIFNHLDAETIYYFIQSTYDDNCKQTTINLLTALVTRSNLIKLKAHLYKNRLLELSPRLNSTIQHLTIIDIDSENFLTILEYSPHLHTLIISGFPEISYNDITSKCFPQLTSLTIKKLSGDQDRFELFLSKTPSLIHMNLNGQGVELDGKRWEQFITKHLPQLNKFDFYLYKHTRSRLPYTSTDVKRIISSFQTPFWIEQKKWFVICEYEISGPHTIYLTSDTMYNFGLAYQTKSTRFSLSTCPILMKNNQTITYHTISFYIDLGKDLTDEFQVENIEAKNYPLCPNVTEIRLMFSQNWNLHSMRTLSNFVDVLKIVHMKIYLGLCDDCYHNLWTNIEVFFEQFKNLSILDINRIHSGHRSKTDNTNIHLFVPRYIKHLQMPICNLNQIKILLERCKNLSTVIFTSDLEDKKFFEEIIKWFADNTVDTTCTYNSDKVDVWLGKKDF